LLLGEDTPVPSAGPEPPTSLRHRLATDLIPPAVYPAAKRFRDRLGGREPEWEYLPEGWDRARSDSRVKGWNVDSLREAYRRKWPGWLAATAGSGPLGVDYIRSIRAHGASDEVPNDLGWAHNVVMSYAYCIARAARMRQRFSIFEWGGGVGQYYQISRALLRGVEVEYGCKEVPVMCELGRELNPDVRFYEDDSWLEGRYDFVFANSALQYAEGWQRLLGQLASVASGHVYISRLALVSRAPSFAVLQRAYQFGETEVIGWFLNRREFLGQATAVGLELVREFVMMDETPAAGAPEQARYSAFLFRAGTAA
jgi:putative methyltransferase (TIGR04325 family)